ncbi:MAG: hypothetical protein BGO98_01260 [Myxococcales bacterium 68-20]|nr:hypothetical protein [Myxococcales bacterium]OJY17558.1 MAG: hypothetical protein BGO98_01260 [Myxococcales bacterium 68-20]
MRTSTEIGVVAPTRITLFVSRTRRSFAWRGSGSSPISARKNAPPSAASKKPSFVEAAPGEGPFAWPKSSLSATLSVSAAQFTSTSGPPALGERR